MDLSRGMLAAVPGWAHVRLLAPAADLRLLVCGHSTLVDSHRLRCTSNSVSPGAHGRTSEMAACHFACLHLLGCGHVTVVDAASGHFALRHVLSRVLTDGGAGIYRSDTLQ